MGCMMISASLAHCDDEFPDAAALDQAVYETTNETFDEPVSYADPITDHDVSDAEFSVDAIPEVIDEPVATDCNGAQSCPGVCRHPGYPEKPKHPRPGDIDEGDCPSKRYRMDDCLRSGDPHCVYKWATPSITDKYSAWYVGGGAFFRGRGRTAEEGTWGLDYDGLFGHARTWLNYTCGKRQGGEGAYETDHVPLKKKIVGH